MSRTLKGLAGFGSDKGFAGFSSDKGFAGFSSDKGFAGFGSDCGASWVRARNQDLGLAAYQWCFGSLGLGN